MKKELRPIVARDTWSVPLSKKIRYLFSGLIYKPIFATIKESSKENGKDASALKRALRAGIVTFKGDLFRGQFSAQISKELKSMGAVYDKVRQGYRLTSCRLPGDVLVEALRARDKAEKIFDAIVLAIDTIPIVVAKFVQGMTFDDEAVITEHQVDARFKTTVTDEIGEVAKLSPRYREKLKDEYTQNIIRSIKGFSQDETEKLRDVVQDHVLTGRPIAELEERIEARYGVSKGRAQLIAKQETKLFTSKLKQVQYENVGISKYRWETVGDDRVRREHRQLNNTIQTWSDPPIINAATGDRGHPGEAVNCRCRAIPIAEIPR